jgi:hypothetical protein
VLAGALPGPYTDAAACRYARTVLVPAELADEAREFQAGRNLALTAAALGLPVGELERGLVEARRRSESAR